MARPVLDLSTLAERPKIAIDGALYDILSPDELSVVDFQRFSTMGRRIEELGAVARPAPEEQSELLKLIVEISDRVMIGVPPEVRSRLSVPSLIRVIEVFIRLLPARKKRPAGAAPDQASPSTGASSPPASSASTAAIPAGGSSKRPSRSSGPM